MLTEAVRLCTILKYTQSNLLVAAKYQYSLTRLLFMEIAVRFSAELQLQASLIPAVLEFFVGRAGIHSEEPRVQLRAWYLFDRLLGKLQKDVAPIADQLLATFTDLLPIRVTIASPHSSQSDDSDSESDSEAQDTLFDSQLYLFQSAGLLVAVTESASEMGQVLLQSLTSSINERLQAGSFNQYAILYIHHCIMAIGDYAKGIENANEVPSNTRQQIGTRLFSPAAETILAALTNCNESSQVRDAVRIFIINNTDRLDSVCVCTASVGPGRKHSRTDSASHRRLAAKEHYI
jgi:exportin-T